MTTRQPSIRIRRDPATAAAVMENPDALHVIRLLPSPGLEGAFRVHVSPDSLDQARLKIGDLCEISSEDGSTGYGIAWRADDRIGTRPKLRPIKLTEFVRSAFGFQEGSRVNIAPTKAKKHHADKVIISDITPAESGKSEDIDDDLWKTRVAYLFSNCEALAPGISFDVLNKSKKTRKRYYIEHIESKTVANDVPSLFKFTDTTQLVFPARGSIVQLDTAAANVNGSNSSNSTDNAPMQYQLNTERIAGLTEICEDLNVQLQQVFAATRQFKRPSLPILLHGFEGTGKTMLLERLAEAPFQKVICLERATLNGGTMTKNVSMIKDLFREAKDSQPSIILMDDMEHLVPADDPTYAKVITAEMRKIRHDRVMIVGAARSHTAIHSTLLGDQNFALEYELPVPDLTVREQMLKILQGKPRYCADNVSSSIALRTYGFTGKDIGTLYTRAYFASMKRILHDANKKMDMQSPVLPRYSQINSTDINPALKDDVTLADFEKVLPDVRPTALREIAFERPRVQWRDIGGSSGIKELFDNIITKSRENLDIVTDLSMRQTKGVLLYGPPGCSKTLIAQAVANMYDYNFITVKGAELISMYVGESERAIRETFRKARSARPCVVFFDEIDSIGGKRDGGGGGTQGLNVLTTLLNEMDGFDALKDVLILAATNKPQTLDPAIMRPGRFDRHVYVGLPNGTARKEILKIETRGILVANDLNLDDLVQKTEGYSGAEIVAVCNEAKEHTYLRRIKGDKVAPMLPEEFERALDVTPRRITKDMLEEFDMFGRND